MSCSIFSERKEYEYPGKERACCIETVLYGVLISGTLSMLIFNLCSYIVGIFLQAGYLTLLQMHFSRQSTSQKTIHCTGEKEKEQQRKDFNL